MTLHLYGSVDGNIFAMSDSRTVFDGLPPDDRVNKVITYPLTESRWEAEVVGGIGEGEFAAILLVQGRARFVPEDDSVDPDGCLAANVVKEFLKENRHRAYHSVRELGDAVWAEIRGLWWKSCKDCREFQAERDASPDPFFDNEICYHEDMGFDLFISAVNDSEALGPACYVRKWGIGRSDYSSLLNDREVRFSAVKAVPECVGLDLDIVGPASELRTELKRKFLSVARPNAPISAEREWCDGVGGLIRIVVLDPQSGFRWLEPFSLQ